MKRLIILAAVALPVGLALAADNPWIGTWKLDPAKSHFTGETITYSKGSGGLMHFSDGSTSSYDFGIDGKEYKAWANRTVSWTATGDNSWDTVVKANGALIAKSHRELSADGNTLTITFTGNQPDGKAFNDKEVYTRTSGTTGLAGTWRSIKVTNPGGPQTFEITSPSAGVLHTEIPDMKATTEGRLDGSDHVITGPTMPPGMTIAQKSDSPTKVTYTIKVDGKVEGQGIQTLAPDGHSFTDVSWNPGKESEKTTAVYVKQ